VPGGRRRHAQTLREREVAAAAPARLRSTVDIAPQRVAPVVALIVVEVLVGAGLLTAELLARPGWQGAAVAVAVALIFVVPVRGTTLPGLVALRWGYLRDRRRRAAAGPVAEPFDVAGPDGTQIGFRWDGTTLMSLIRLDENPQAMTVLEPGMTVSGEMVPVQDMADCLRQFDITVSSIDIISQGARSSGHTEVAAVYDEVLGPLPAIAQRTVWIAVRFDPSLCAQAVPRRGGGRDGIMRTATTATRRVANRLTEAGLRPRILSASGIAQATNQLGDGVNLATLEETWRMCREGQFRLRSFAVQPEALTTAGLGVVWTVPSYSTTVCLSLREADDPELVALRGLVRFDSHGPNRARVGGLAPLRGQQFSALTASLPVPPAPRTVGHWLYGRHGVDLSGLAVPASGCGQVIGADERGRAVALPLFGPQINRVEICGTLHLAQQAVLRSLALGARVLVHSRRPALWRDMVDEVGDQDLLWVADFNRGAIQAGADRNYSVEVFDRVAEQGVRVGVTAVVVSPPGTAVTPNADVSLELVSYEDDLVKVSTRAGSSSVTMVATDEEMHYIKASASLGD
jgi:type VII secretion protein EccE